MKKYKVTLQGKNLLLKMERVEKHGVFIVRFVEAIDEVLAEHTALEDFRCSPKGKTLQESLLNTTDDPPVFQAIEIRQLKSFGTADNSGGLIFYPEDSEA